MEHIDELRLLKDTEKMDELLNVLSTEMKEDSITTSAAMGYMLMAANKIGLEADLANDMIKGMKTCIKDNNSKQAEETYAKCLKDQPIHEIHDTLCNIYRELEELNRKKNAPETEINTMTMTDQSCDHQRINRDNPWYNINLGGSYVSRKAKQTNTFNFNFKSLFVFLDYLERNSRD